MSTPPPVGPNTPVPEGRLKQSYPAPCAMGAILLFICLAARASAVDVTQSGTKLTVTGANFRYTWDTRRGGEMSEFEQRTVPTKGWWNEANPRAQRSEWLRVNGSFAWKSLDTIPALSFSTNRGAYYSGEWHIAYANADNKATLNLISKGPGEVVFETLSRPKILENRRSPVPWIVRQTVRVFDSGVVLTDIEIDLPEDELYELDWAQMFVNLDDGLYKEFHPTRSASFSFGWAVTGGTSQQFDRWKGYLQDLKHLPLDMDVVLKSTVFTRHPLLFGSAGYEMTHRKGSAKNGWMACSLTDARSLVGTKEDFGSHFLVRPQSGMSPVPTWEGRMRSNPCFGFGWNLFDGKTRGLNEPLTYRNRLALAATCRKHSSLPGAAADDRNVLIGARIYAASKMPAPTDVKNMATDGCDTLILPADWRANGAATAAVVQAAHAAGIRVGATVDATDVKALVTDAMWFTDVFAPGRDGLCVRNASHLVNAPPAGMFTVSGQPVTFKRDGAWRSDAASFAICMRALRGIVGERGFLIGEPGEIGPDLLSLAEFDLHASDALKPYEWNTPAARHDIRYRAGAGFAPILATMNPAWQALAAMHADTPIIAFPPTDKTHLPHWKRMAKLPPGGVYMSSDLPATEQVFTTTSPEVHGTLYLGASGKGVLLLAAGKPAGNVTVRFARKLTSVLEADKPVHIEADEFDAGAFTASQVKAYFVTVAEEGK